jgi:ADP-ribose pyrophosphatase YjhB (NUDIX family)
MTKEYTEEENRIWRAQQPQKMIVVKVIIRSDQGNILLAKPSYKKSWQLPGGGVDDSESPEDAVVREVQEELSLAISKDGLYLKGTIYKQDEELLFLMYEASEVIPEDTKLKVEKGEITDFQFVSVDAVAPFISDYYADFWKKHYS